MYTVSPQFSLFLLIQVVDSIGQWPMREVSQELGQPHASNQTVEWPFPERPKPPCSLTDIIAMAILSSTNRQANFAEINGFIKRWFPYYRQSKEQEKRWHGTVDRRLRNKEFIKLPKISQSSPPLYCLQPDFIEQFKTKQSLLKKQLHGHTEPDFVWSFI